MTFVLFFFSRRPSASVTAPPYGRSMSTGHNQNTRIPGDNAVYDYCPMCYMIYPEKMSDLDQSRHTEEHYSRQ